MKYVIVHIIKGRIVGYAKCKTKKDVLEFAADVRKRYDLHFNLDYLWSNGFHQITEQSCLEIL